MTRLIDRRNIDFLLHDWLKADALVDRDALLTFVASRSNVASEAPTAIF